MCKGTLAQFNILCINFILLSRPNGKVVKGYITVSYEEIVSQMSEKSKTENSSQLTVETTAVSSVKSKRTKTHKSKAHSRKELQKLDSPHATKMHFQAIIQSKLSLTIRIETSFKFDDFDEKNSSIFLAASILAHCNLFPVRIWIGDFNAHLSKTKKKQNIKLIFWRIIIKKCQILAQIMILILFLFFFEFEPKAISLSSSFDVFLMTDIT